MKRNNLEEGTPISPKDLASLLDQEAQKDAIQLHSEKLFATALEDRMIWVDLEISTQTSYIAPTILDIEKQILQWNKEDFGKPVEERKPIKLLLYCFGGDLDATLSLVSLMNISTTPIYTYNMGVAFSGGFLLLINGHKRFTLATGTGLFHEGSAEVQGSAQEVRSAQANYERELKTIKDIIVAHSKIDLKTLNKYKDKEWYIPANQLLELGVVDEIITSIDQILG